MRKEFRKEQGRKGEKRESRVEAGKMGGKKRKAEGKDVKRERMECVKE